ncbi:MAG: hypothetical protein FD143_652 [Ignavibacteria bacterium]|nr:MAG: hypothetical protein FD143_652 [Ignavibacteria bacterium]KAF0161482.1 MAG: hypothetical protein FD188_853 [Ignavibacteria bacterium]
MNKYLLNILLLTFIIILSVSGCKQKDDELQKDKQNPYSVSLGNFNTYEHALKFKTKLSDSVRAHSRLESTAKKSYKILYGKYSTSYDAGEKGFELFLQKYIMDYEINRNGQRVLDEFINVPFIGFYLGKPALYNYNLKTRQTEILWSRFNKKVLSVRLTQKAKAVFLITAETISKNKSQSSLREAAVHFLRRNEDESEELKQLGNVDRIYSYWDLPDTFRINTTFPDSNSSRIIYQRIYSWDNYGRIGKISQRSFDLLLQGYPVKPKIKQEVFSPNSLLQIRVTKTNETAYFYIKNFPDKSELLALALHGEIKDIRWSDDSRYVLVISEEIIKPNKTGAKQNQLLAIYDTFSKKVVRIIEGTGFNNLLLRGKFLFFDESLNGSKHIVITDIQDKTVYDRINLPGGCALNTLPE